LEIYNKIRNKSETINSFISKSELFNKNKPLIINNKLIIGVFIRIYKKVKDGKICYVANIIIKILYFFIILRNIFIYLFIITIFQFFKIFYRITVISLFRATI